MGRRSKLAGGEILGSNPLFREHWEQVIARIQAHTGDPSDPVIPFTHDSEDRGENGAPISGVFAGLAAA